jgi:hypothetical protein
MPRSRSPASTTVARDLSSLPPILKTLVAFANTAGGTLVIGIGDDGGVVGISPPMISIRSAFGATSRPSGARSARSIWSRWAYWSPRQAGLRHRTAA